MSTIYCVPGLGADARLYCNFEKLTDHTIIHLAWIAPLNNETLADYAKRLSEQIDTSEKDIILMGVSLGGMIIQEIAKHRDTKALIIISSIKKKSEIPLYFEIGKAMNFGKFVLNLDIKKRTKLLAKFIRKSSSENHQLLLDMLESIEIQFIAWAIGAIPHWTPPTSATPFIHIHGTLDLVIPEIFIKNHIKIKGGSHQIILTHAPIIVKETEAFLMNL